MSSHSSRQFITQFTIVFSECLYCHALIECVMSFDVMI